jgi:cysteine desulfurase/selenocysteine lyase
MSTSEPGKGAQNLQRDSFVTVGPSTAASLADGFPNPEVLARMANEFFTALPGAPSAAEPLIAAAQQTASASAAPEPLGTEAGASSAISDVVSYPILTEEVGYPPSPMSVPRGDALFGPGFIPAADFDNLVRFSFLEEIRPLFSSAASPMFPAASFPSTVKIPTETEIKSLADSLSTNPPPQIPEHHNFLAAPQLAGAASQPGASEASSAFSFLSEIRQLFPAGVATVPASDPFRIPSATLPGLNLTSGPFDVQAIRRDFPILQERVHGKPLIWLDNAATTQKPQSVIDRLSDFYSHENSNIHRAAHELAARATDAYEAARENVRRFINASTVREIIFVRGTTEAINLVAQSWGRQNIQKDDEIVITWLEHHANIVPWQMLCAEKGARLRVAPVDNSGQVLLDEYQKLLGPRTRLVSFAQVSNALGTVTPAQEMIEMAHRYGAKVLLDGAQAVSHMRTDVQLYDCDFYVFSGHKMFGPTGIGVVFGKLDILENTQPWHGGGNMIQDVTFEKTTYQPPPGRFEAGTGNIADAVGLGAAIDYVERVGMHNIARYEHDLLVYATEALQHIPGLRLIGTAKEKAGVLSFVLDGFRTEDVGAALNRQGIAVRAGHHCAQPILRRFGVETTVRPSLALYNTCEEIDALVAAIWNLKQGHNSL